MPTGVRWKGVMMVELCGVVGSCSPRCEKSPNEKAGGLGPVCAGLGEEKASALQEVGALQAGTTLYNTWQWRL